MASAGGWPTTSYWSQFAGQAAVPVAVGVGFALARKYVKSSAGLTSQQLSALDDRFRLTKWLVGVSMIVIGMAFYWSTNSLLVFLNKLFAAGDGTQTVLRFWPQNAIWWFFPGFGAIAFCWEITLQLWSIFGKSQDARSYRLWSDGRARFDATRILRWMGLVIVGPIGVFTALALPMHTAFRTNDIRDCGYGWTGCTTYEYSKAVQMTQIQGYRDRDGNLEHRAVIVLDFADGRRWSSAEMGEFRDSVDPQLSSLLVQRTGLPLGHAETEKDVPKHQAVEN